MTMLLTIVGLLSGMASATTYYVSSSSGSDANAGTSQSAPWQTVAHVNAQTFAAGDSILFKRGDVWNESLVPPSSGSSGNPITFDAYGTGAAPNLTGYYAVPATAWSLVTGNAWKATLPANYSTVNFCLFGSIWGQKVAASSSNLTADWNFYFVAGTIRVYSAGNPASYYNGAIVPMAVSNTPLIDTNGKSWLVFQHFLLNWFDQFGVYVQGTSDHLVFANMEADSMIPQGTQPLGFYVNETSGAGPGDIKFYNDEAHLNYDGFRMDGVATAITLVNDKAYANRDGALVDNTGAVNYSYSHFYASSLAVANSTDVEFTTGSGPTAGAGNVTTDTPPAVQAWQRYPARVTLTVDDIGMTTGADSYYGSTVLPIADAASVPVGVAITVGYTARIAPIVSEIQGWINAGRDVTSHSISHTYYPNTDALDIQYTGSGTAATLSISGKVLTITVTGASDSVSYNLAQGLPQGTILGLKTALNATGKFTAAENPVCASLYGTGCSFNTEEALLSQDLADVSGINVKSGVYAMLLDVTRLTTDEITLSRNWMTANLTGLPSSPVYVYPGGFETPTMQGITAGVPYNGARGALKEDLGVKDTYASGFDVQNITSFGVNPSWQGLAAAALNQKIQALIWKQRVWGVPWGIFWHNAELTSTEITNLIADFKNGGATIQTNTGLVNTLLGGTLYSGTDGNFYYKSPATSMTLDFRPTRSSPVVDAGQNLGTAYQIDINGVNQNSYGSGWEIGAHTFIPDSIYGIAGSPPGSYSSFRIACTAPIYSCARNDMTTVANLNPPPSLSGQNSLATPGDFNLPILRVTDTQTFIPSSGGAGKTFNVTPSGANSDNIFNTNDTYMMVDDQGGFRYPVALSPSTMQVLNSYNAIGTWNPGVNQQRWAGSSSFSRTNPNLIYSVLRSSSWGVTVPSSHTWLYGLTLSGTAPVSVSAAQIFDLGTCPGMTPGYITSSNSTMTVTAGDTKIAIDLSNNGGQGTGFDALVYTLGTGTCVRYDTGGSTGGSGVGQLCTGTSTSYTCTPMSLSDTFGLHEVYLSLDGNWMRLVPTPQAGTTCATSSNCNGFSTSNPYLWQVGTTNVVRCGGGTPSAMCQGHQVEGYTHLFNTGGPWPQLQERSFSSPLTYTVWNPGVNFGSLDDHISDNNQNSTDTNPVWETNYPNPNTANGGAGCNTTGNLFLGCTWPGPLYGEIFGMTPAGGYIRAAHSYNSASSAYFNCGHTIGSVSQTGKFFAWVSDWLTTLGNDDTGVPRCDVFVVRLDAQQGAAF